MSKGCEPSGDEGSRNGLVQGFKALAGSGFGEFGMNKPSHIGPSLT